jgi:hypothetical protein
MHQIDRPHRRRSKPAAQGGRIERRSSIVNGSNTVRVIAGIVLALIVAAIGIGAYQLGVQTSVAQETGTAVAPAVAYYGWHPFGFGFGFFGFFGTLLFFLLIFVLIRAVVFGGRGRRWGGPGYGGPGGWRGGPWESRARQTFEDWHRDAHEGRTTGAEPGAAPGPDDPNRA